MEIDRQTIERRDFPIGRRGYDPAAVDAHLRSLANEIEELQRAAAGGAKPSLASTAGTQVQSILTAAETAAEDIESEALARATAAREDADGDAARTRQEAIDQARAHVAAVTRATAVLLERVSAMDAEVSGLVESLRAGASRLADDLAAVTTNMGELYDAASGRENVVSDRAGAASGDEPAPEASPPPALDAPAPARDAPATAAVLDPSAAQAHAAPGAAVENGDLDGARLIALNMALNGESRADAERYLAENYKLADRKKLIDEVYAAIEG